MMKVKFKRQFEQLFFGMEFVSVQNVNDNLKIY
jgi:hypothetical protein